MILDIRLRNVLSRLPSSFDHLSIPQFYGEYGKPETVPIEREDGKPLTSSISAKAVIPVSLGKSAELFTLADAEILLSDYGEAFAPASEPRRAEDSHIPLSYRPLEARFEPEGALTQSADIWSLAVSIWEIIGMRMIFSDEFRTEDDVVCQYVDALGPMPRKWWERWEARHQFFNEDGSPKEGREIWPPALDDAFEDFVQKYRRRFESGEFDKEESVALVDLMRRMLAFEPEKRPSAGEVLGWGRARSWI